MTDSASGGRFRPMTFTVNPDIGLRRKDEAGTVIPFEDDRRIGTGSGVTPGNPGAARTARMSPQLTSYLPVDFAIGDR